MALPGYWRQGDYLYSSKDGFTASPETRYRPPQTLNLTALGFISSRTKIGSTPVNFSGAPAFSVAARRRRGSVHSETSCFLGSIWKCASFPRNLQKTQSVAVLGMRNGTSQSPFRPALGRQLVRAADAPLRGHGFGTSRLRQTPTTNGLTAYRMRLHLACVSSGTYGPFATSASRSRLRLPRTTRLALRASLAGSV